MRAIIRRILLGTLDLSRSIIDFFKSRVLSNGGVIEGEQCAYNALNSLDAKALLSSATFVLVPSGYKASTVYAELPQNGNGDLTFTRGTIATRVNSSGVIESVDSNISRLDYSLGGCPTLLVEPQRSNYAINTDVGATQTISTGLVNGRKYVLSFYGMGRITYSGGASGTLNGTGANNRVSVVITMASTSITLTVSGSITNIQFEGSTVDANYATSYIPNGESGIVTREADTFTRNNIYTNGLIGPSGGTWLIEIKNNLSYVRDAQGGFGLADSTNLLTGNSLFLTNNSSVVTVFKRVSGSATQIGTTSGNSKIVVNWNGSNCNVFINGVKVTINSAFSTTSLNYIASTIADAPKYIAQMALWNTPLSDAQCISLTT